MGTVPWARNFNESWIRQTLYEFPGAPHQGDVRIGQAREQGFHVDWFADLIERYISPGEIPDTPDNIDHKNKAVGSVGSASTPIETEATHVGTKDETDSGLGRTAADIVNLEARRRQLCRPDGEADAAMAFEERAASLEYDGGLTRAEAEARAAREFPELPTFLDRRRTQ